MFSINEKCSIVIYGAATSGKIIYDILKKSHIDVVAFIDKRADELGELYGKRVAASMDDLSDLVCEDCVIIIAVKNVFEHSKIAARLLQSGINCILYKPHAVLAGGGTDDEKRISECYDCLLNNRLDKLVHIPETYNIAVYECHDSAVVREEDGYIWARIPVSLIYTNKSNDKSIWGDIPILSMFPHIGLFQEFLCEQSEGGIEDYVDFCSEAAKNAGDIKITERWKQNVVSNRLDVFYHMETAYQLDRDFFLRNAPRAEWNDAGYFNLLGGKHRCTFLAAKGDQYITLQLLKKDYDAWINHNRAFDLNERLNRIFQNRKGTGIIEHPFFYQYPLDGGTFFYKMWVRICMFLSRYIYVKQHDFMFGDMTAFVSVEDMGYTARNLSRAGMKVYRKTENMQIEREIDEVTGVAAGEYLQEENEPDVDVAVVENVKYGKAKFCFTVSDRRLETGDTGKIFLEGFMSQGKKYLYLFDQL